jgi:hypothetical protein
MIESTIQNKMQITYCNGWSRYKKCSNQIWSKEKAFQVHQKKELYTVLIGDPEKPICFLEINLSLNYVGVDFLDEYLRNYLHYTFADPDGDMLFLKEVAYREYQEDTDRVVKAIISRFARDGRITVEKVDLVTNECNIKDCSVEISTNWEKIPEFGKYESIARFERNSG